MWNLKTKVIAFTIGMFAIIPKSFIKFVNNTPGKHNMKYIEQPYCVLHTYFEKY
jgi:hypothetical protein